MSYDPRLPRYADSHDPFWPRVDLGRLRERLNLTWPVSEAALEVAARCAAIDAAREFARWRAVLRERGRFRLTRLRHILLHIWYGDGCQDSDDRDDHH